MIPSPKTTDDDHISSNMWPYIAGESCWFAEGIINQTIEIVLFLHLPWMNFHKSNYVVNMSWFERTAVALATSCVLNSEVYFALIINGLTWFKALNWAESRVQKLVPPNVHIYHIVECYQVSIWDNQCEKSGYSCHLFKIYADT